MIEALVAKLQPQQVCKKLNLCSSDKWLRTLMNDRPVSSLYFAASAKDSAVCTTCQQVVNYTQGYIKSNETKIEEALNNACSVLPDQMKTLCQTVVLIYGPKIIQFIEAENPLTACQLVGLCPKNTTVSETPKSTDGPQCTLCKYILGAVEKHLSDNSTEQQIKSGLKKVCAALPSSFSVQCDALVDQYLDLLVQLIQQKLPADKICTYIGICSGKTVEEPENAIPICPACLFLVTELEQRLASNATEQQIVAALNKVCEKAPAFLRSPCQSLVSQYAPVIVQKILQKADPSTVCKAVKACSSAAAPVPVAAATKQESVALCTACKFLITAVESKISSNATEQQIVAALNKVCDSAPIFLRTPCHMLVTEYGATIVEKLLQKADPDTICKAIGACSSSKVEQVIKPIMTQLKEQNGQYCAMCLQIASYLETAIQSNQTSEQIIEALQKVCSFVPTQYQDQCKVVLPFVWKEIVQSLLNKEPPSIICKQLHFCDNATASCMQTQVNTFSNDQICAGCKYLVNVAGSYLDQNSTKAEVKQFVEQQVCSHFPTKYSGLCKLVVEQYGDKVIDELVVKVFNADKVCSAVHACAAKKASNKPQGNKIRIH